MEMQTMPSRVLLRNTNATKRGNATVPNFRMEILEELAVHITAPRIRIWPLKGKRPHVAKVTRRNCHALLN